MPRVDLTSDRQDGNPVVLDPRPECAHVDFFVVKKNNTLTVGYTSMLVSSRLDFEQRHPSVTNHVNLVSYYGWNEKYLHCDDVSFLLLGEGERRRSLIYIISITERHLCGETKTIDNEERIPRIIVSKLVIMSNILLSLIEADHLSPQFKMIFFSSELYVGLSYVSKGVYIYI